jgi:cytochrome b subunit of formate dehydrogenase
MMGIAFLICFITGFFKFTLLMRTFSLTDIVLPLALMSDIHDWAGITLGFLVAAHLFLNRAWILSMTRKMVTGTVDIK